MSLHFPAPSKQRTRQHVIASQSLNYVERFIIDEGHVALRMESDYGYDLVLFTFDAAGYCEPGLVFLQLKASETLEEVGNDYVYDVDIRDYNLWIREDSPVFLVLFDASRRRGYWLHFQQYFQAEPSRRPERKQKTVRVRVPRRQAIGGRGVAKMRAAKPPVLALLEGGD